MFDVLQKRAVSFLSDNSAAILTAGGVVGTVATAVLSGRAAYKAAEIINDERNRRLTDPTVGNQTVDIGDVDTHVDLTTTDKVKLVGLQFIPPVLLGVATITAIIMSNRMSAQRAAALAAAYGITQKQLEEYKAKLEEKLSPKKFEEARGEIQQKRIDDRPPSRNIILVGTGPVLCYDSFSDRYFKSTADHLRKAERVVNGEIDTGNECKLGVFYRELELPETQFDDMLGWNIQNPCRIVIDAMLMNDDACLCLEFMNLPVPNFAVDY